MNVLLLHNNFPGQFNNLAAALAARPGARVVFLSCFCRNDVRVPGVLWRQVLLPGKGEGNKKDSNPPPPLRMADHFANAMFALKKEGFRPDVVHGHAGFGPLLYAPDIFPDAGHMSFFEWYYTDGADRAFFGKLDDGHSDKRLGHRQSNACVLSALDASVVGICPTEWQRRQHPTQYHDKIRILHDGVDTDFFSPQPSFTLTVNGVNLKDAEVVTYATRGLEPYRGFPTFFRSLPAVLQARPKTHVLIMAHDRTVYGSKRSDGKTWRQALLEEVDVDESRVHFLPFQPYPKYRSLLRASHAHVYLSAPFVLSWSAIEAMSCGCLLIGSDTEPVREVVRHDENGLLTDFWDPAALADAIIYALENREKMERLRRAARQTVLNRYSLRTLLPQHMALVDMTASRSKKREQAEAN